MTIGRADDPVNPFVATAFEAAEVFGAGSRTPSGPAVMAPRRQGRTHDRNRPARQTSHFFSCTQGAVHTCTNAPASDTARRPKGYLQSDPPDLDPARLGEAVPSNALQLHQEHFLA